jgi:hypothetical protein
MSRPIPHMPFAAPVHNDLQDIEIVQLAGEIAPGFAAPNSGVRYPGPKRIAIYHQSWGGERVWNADINLDYPAELRPVIVGQNVQATALTTLARVAAPGAAPRPIPLADYSLQTRMVYVGGQAGTIGEDGRINR